MPAVYKSEAESLIDYMYWVNERLLEAAERLTEEAYLGSAGPVRSLRLTLVHELDVEWSWRLNLLGTIGDEDDLQAEDFPDVKTLRARWQQDEAEMRSWVGGLSDKELEREVSSEFTQERRPLWQYLLHIVFHGAQQQADAAAMLTAAGESPTEIGYLEYLRRHTPTSAG